MPEPKRPLTMREIMALEAQQNAQRPGIAPLLGGSATLGGPSPSQEAQASGAAARGVPTLGEATPAELGTAAARTTAAGVGIDPDNPVASAAVLGGTLVGGPALGLAGRAVGFQRAVAPLLLSGNRLVRAGSPILAGGARMMDRALGASAGALVGGELTASPMETSPEAMSRRLWDAALGAGTEVVGPLGIAAVRTARALPGTAYRLMGGRTGGQSAGQYFMDRLLGRSSAAPLIPHAEEIQAALRRRGQTATIGQLSTSRWHQTAESLLEAGWTSRGQYGATHQGALDAAWDDWDAALPEFGRRMSQAERGTLVDEVIDGSETLKNLAVDSQYNKARALAESRGVQDNVVFIDEVIRDLYNDGPLQNALKGGDEFAETIWDLVTKQLANARDLPMIQQAMGTSYAKITFEQAEALRRTLMQIAGSGKQSTVKGTQKLAIGVARSLDRAMDNSAAALGVPEVRAAYLAARSFTHTASEPFNDKALAALIASGKVRPEQIAQSLARAGNPGQIQAVMRVVDNPEYQQAVLDAIAPYGGTTVQDFKDMLVNNYLEDTALRAGRRHSTVPPPQPGGIPGLVGAVATPDASPEVLKQGSGERLLTLMTGSKGTFEALVPNVDARRNLEVAARTIAAAESRSKERLATMFFQMSQAATGALAARGLMTGFKDGAGMLPAGLVLLPRALASFTNAPRVVDWMLRRARTAPGRASNLTGRAATQWAISSTAEYISRLRDAGIPFTYRGPDGQETTFDPSLGVSGQYAPGSGMKPATKPGVAPR